MSQTPEHKVMNAIRLECGKRNWICVRVNVGGGKLANGQWFQACDMLGYPDLTIFADNGRVILCECKAGKGKLRDDQVKFHNELLKRGFEVIVAYSVEEFIAKCDLRR